MHFYVGINVSEIGQNLMRSGHWILPLVSRMNLTQSNGMAINNAPYTNGVPGLVKESAIVSPEHSHASSGIFPDNADVISSSLELGKPVQQSTDNQPELTINKVQRPQDIIREVNDSITHNPPITGLNRYKIDEDDTPDFTDEDFKKADSTDGFVDNDFTDDEWCKMIGE